MKRTPLIILTALITLGIILLRVDGPAVTAQTSRPNATPTPVAAPTIVPTPTPEEIIRIDTELVNLNVRVIDRNNRPINNIQQREFKIYEDGVLQQIDFF